MEEKAGITWRMSAMFILAVGVLIVAPSVWAFSVGPIPTPHCPPESGTISDARCFR